MNKPLFGGSKGVRSFFQFSAARTTRLRNIGRIILLLWTCSPALTTATVALRIFQAFQPPAAFYVGKLIVDTVVSHRSASLVKISLLDWLTDVADEKLILFIGLEFVLIVTFDLASRATSAIDGILNERYTNALSLELMQHATSLDLKQFESSDVQDLLERARRQASGRNNLLIQGCNIGQTFVTIVSLAIGILIYAPWLIALLLVALLPAAVKEARFNEEAYEISRARTTERREMQYFRYIGASPENAKELKLFNLGPFMITRFRRAAELVSAHNRKLAIRRLMWGGALGAVGSFAYYTIYTSIVWNTVRGHFTLGDLTFLSASFLRLHGSLTSLLTAITQTANQAQNLDDYYSFLDLTPTIRSPSKSKPFPKKIEDGIRFTDVGFKYPETDRWAIQHFNLKIGPQETIALVGENGAGKTTIVKLLTRLYEPDAGVITIDGVPLQEFNLTDLRANIGVIFQDFIRYSLSAGENIGVGHIDTLDDAERIQNAAREGMAADLISSLPLAYAQPLGQRTTKGLELSGGEWQKIAISRAYMRNAALLILDEPTSALDARAEMEVFERLHALREGRAGLIISHRFSTVRRADRIVVLRGGQIIELGDHDALMALNGVYAELFLIQANSFR